MTAPIVVAVDPSRPRPEALDVGLRLHELTGAPLLLCAVHRHAPGVAPIPSWEPLSREARQAVEAIAAPLEARGVPVETTVVGRPHPAEGLCDVVRRADAALLVIGRGHRGRFGRVVPGGTLERLVHGVPCPIVVAPPGEWTEATLERIGVGFTDTPEARAAAADAAVFAGAIGAGLQLIAAFDPAPAVVTPMAPALPLPPPDPRVVRARLADAARDCSAVANVFTRVVDGDPATVLIDATSRLDMLICGSRGRGPVAGALLGSVTQQIARHARCPLVLLPLEAAGGLSRLVGRAVPEPVA